MLCDWDDKILYDLRVTRPPGIWPRLQRPTGSPNQSRSLGARASQQAPWFLSLLNEQEGLKAADTAAAVPAAAAGSPFGVRGVLLGVAVNALSNLLSPEE
ncbi:hypothetical protein Efla_005156 [Eimeria flavescens]